MPKSENSLRKFVLFCQELDDTDNLARAAKGIQIAWYEVQKAIPRKELKASFGKQHLSPCP